jgi:peptidoglycan hydrolase CwlO-like protein
MYLSDQPRNAFFAKMWDRDSRSATLSAIEHSQQKLESGISAMASHVQSLKQMDKKVSELEHSCKRLQELIDCQNKTIESLQSIVKGEQAAPVRQSAKP